MIKYKFKQYGNELRFNYCPICGKIKKNPDFSINIKTKQYYCHTTAQGGTLEQLKRDYNFNLEEIKGVNTIQTQETKGQKNFNEIFLRNHKDFNEEWKEYLKKRGIYNLDNIKKVCRMSKNNLMMIPITNGENIIAIKYRSIDKKISSESGSQTNYFLNWQNVKDFSSIIIVEGEIDLLTALEVGFNNVISLPFGAKNVKCVDNQKLWLEKFEKIIIATDNDEVGKESKERIKSILNNVAYKLYEVDLGKYKDFNEVLQTEGKEKTAEIIKKIVPLPFDKSIFYSSRNKFLFDAFSNYLINKYNIINIEDELYVFNGKIYQKDKQIEKVMIEEIKDLSYKNRSETLKYLYLTAPTKTRNENGLITFNNGIYSILEDKLHPFNSDFIITNLIPWDYKKGVYSELMDNTLNNLACNDKEIRILIDELIGYTLFSKNQLGKAFIIVGDKANGKSTFLNCIKYMIGETNTSFLSLTDITNSRFRVIETKDKLLNIGDDIGSGYIPESENLKKLITGDPITAEKKGKDPIKFNCYAKFIFSANEIPQIKDPTGAMLRRLIIIPFLNSFTKKNKDYDPYFMDKLKNKECMEYLIYIGIEGLKRVLKNKGFTETEKTKALLKEFNENNNPIIDYINFLENEGETPIKLDFILKDFSCQKIYNGILGTIDPQGKKPSFNEWCVNNGLKKISYKSFIKNMKIQFNLDTERKTVKGIKETYFYKRTPRTK